VPEPGVGIAVTKPVFPIGDLEQYVGMAGLIEVAPATQLVAAELTPDLGDRRVVSVPSAWVKQPGAISRDEFAGGVARPEGIGPATRPTGIHGTFRLAPTPLPRAPRIRIGRDALTIAGAKSASRACPRCCFSLRMSFSRYRRWRCAGVMVFRPIGLRPNFTAFTIS
jgi:hypothetical protein